MSLLLKWSELSPFKKGANYSFLRVLGDEKIPAIRLFRDFTLHLKLKKEFTTVKIIPRHFHIQFFSVIISS